MTYEDRNTLLNNEKFIAQCQIALCDWVNYWAVNGTQEIEDEALRLKTEQFLRSFIANPYAYTRKIATLAISENVIKNAIEVTDANVTAAVTNLLSHTLDFLM